MEISGETGRFRFSDDIAMRTGETITLRAHAYKETDDAYVFVALMEGDPAYEYQLLKLPAALVEDVDGGGQSPQGGQ